MRLIDADALTYAIEKRMDDITDESFAEGMSEAIVEIKFQPTIESARRASGNRLAHQDTGQAQDMLTNAVCAGK